MTTGCGRTDYIVLYIVLPAALQTAGPSLSHCSGWELANRQGRPVCRRAAHPHDCSDESSGDNERSECGESTDSDE